MVFIFGSRLYGKVDEIPGVGHVATRFAHIDYIPLFPTEGWFVTSQNGNQWRGVRIPMSLKSVCMGWCRVISCIGGIIGIVLLILAMLDSKSADLVTAALTAFFGVGFYIFSVTYKGITKANYARACALARLIGMNERGIADLARLYNEAPPTFGFEPVPVRAEVAALPAVPIPSGPIPLAPELLTFFVTGRDRASGQEVCVTVHAATEDDALQSALSDGIEVERIEPAGELAT